MHEETISPENVQLTLAFLADELHDVLPELVGPLNNEVHGHLLDMLFNAIASYALVLGFKIEPFQERLKHIYDEQVRSGEFTPIEHH